MVNAAYGALKKNVFNLIFAAAQQKALELFAQ